MVPDKEELLKKRVLYIGSAVPLETAEGLEGVQKPLLERYPVENDNSIEGIVCYLSIVKNGFVVQYLSDPNRKLFFPISSLTLCAAVRCVTSVSSASGGEKSARFMSISHPAAGGANAKRPAIFTTITRRTEGRKILECHGFICSSDKDALELVESTSFVDKTYKGKMNGTTPVQAQYETSTLQSNSASASVVNASGTAAVGVADEDQPVRLVTGGGRDSASQRIAPEFYEPPPLHGYFYKTPESQIKTYTVERVVEGGAERLRAISNSAPITTPRGPVSDRKPMYMDRSYMTLPPPQGRQVIPVRVIPANAMRPRFFSPPPPLARPYPVAMPPAPRPMDPYMMVPPPMGAPVPMMQPQYVLVNPSTRRRRSHSSGSSGSSSPGSPRKANGHGEGEEGGGGAVNENGAEGSTEDSSRPHSPPTDYEKGGRASRRELFEHSQHHLREVNAAPIHYSTMPGEGGGAPPYGMYMMYPPHYMGYPPYMFERARSVPPHVDRGLAKDGRKGGKSKKDKKKKNKRRVHGGGGGKDPAPSDISTDSVGYTSEIGPGGEYPRMPRDFRRFENQFKHERAFSKSLKEEGSKAEPGEDSGNAYSLNERMSKKGSSPGGEEFNLY